MNHHLFLVPDIGEGTAEVELVQWHVKPGEHIEEDQIVAELMTDKATVEVPSPITGRVLQCFGTTGQMLAVGAPLLEIEIQHSENSTEPQQSGPIVATADETPTQTTQAPTPAMPDSPASADAKPLAAPAVRAKAHALGIPLQLVDGSGPEGRITHDDLEAHRAAGAAPPIAVARHARHANQAVTAVPVIGLRRRIAQQMQESKRRIPHFSYIEEVDVTDLEEFRSYLNANRRPEQVKLTLLPFIIQALVQALPEFPQMNARFDDDNGVVHRHGGVHVGIATQTQNGLIVPVLRHAETLDLWGIAREVARLAAATRAGTAQRDELSGSTITITSLGPLGGLAHTPVINHPEVAIIGPNKIVERVVVKGGAFVARKLMNISSSFDHRVVDGWDAAEFIQRIRTCLERPALLFMDALDNNATRAQQPLADNARHASS